MELYLLAVTNLNALIKCKINGNSEGKYYSLIMIVKMYFHENIYCQRQNLMTLFSVKGK